MTPNPLLWVDVESTGLDPAKDCLLEVAVVITDGDLNEIGEPFSAAVRPSFRAFAAMEPVVREMHEKNGLIAELDDALDPPTVQGELLTYLHDFGLPPRSAPLAGNNVGFDRGILAAHMPDVLEFAHYRNVDVSTVKELARRWVPEVAESAPAKSGGHRALGDILDSVEELRHYRRAGVFERPAYVARAAMPADVHVTQPAEIVYPDRATARGHERQCKVCRVIEGIEEPGQRQRVEAVLADGTIPGLVVLEEFRRRGIELSDMSVYRHRAWLRRKV